MQRRKSIHGLFYGCSRWPLCKSAHGCHPDGRPLGIPGNAATKAARMVAHDAFDAMWKRAGWKRPTAYKWMQQALRLSVDEAHIAMFDIEQCERLTEICLAQTTETLWQFAPPHGMKVAPVKGRTDAQRARRKRTKQRAKERKRLERTGATTETGQ